MATLLNEKQVSKILGLPASSLERASWEGTKPKFTELDHAVRYRHLDSWPPVTTCKRVLEFMILPIQGGSR